jgi:hypothetical protein
LETQINLLCTNKQRGSAFSNKTDHVQTNATKDTWVNPEWDCS